MKNLKTLFLFLLITTIAYAQKGGVKGFIYESKTGEPSIFVPVYLKGTTYGAQTDVNGYFNITNVPPGSYTLMCRQIGYDTAQTEIKINANEILTQRLDIVPSSVQMKAVEISAARQEKVTQVQTSLTKITPKEMKMVPAIGGEADVAQYMQVLPGVVFTGDQGGQLYIRGSTPIQNKVILDGMVIYNPFHSIGFYSVFDADYIRNIDVYTGGFPANYGGRTGAIMDITTRDGNKKKHSGKVGINTFTSKILLEGPIVRQKEDLNKGSISYLFSAKKSFLDQTSKSFYNFLDKFDSTYNSKTGLPFKFRDLYGKLSFNGPNGSKFNVFGFNLSDSVVYQGVSNIGWKSFGGGANFILIPSNSNILLKGNFAYSQYDIGFREAVINPRSSSIGGYNGGINATYFMGKHDLDYGVELYGFQTKFNFTSGVGRNIESTENTTELATYFRFKYTAGKLLLEPSIRLHYYASINKPSLEPRFGFKYNVSRGFRIKGSSGVYTQNLISGSSDRDVVNLFYGFLSGPDLSQNPKYKYFYRGESNGIPIKDSTELVNVLQTATHVVGGFEIDITRDFDINIEAYDKRFNQLTNVNRDKLFENNDETKPDFQKKDFVVETGFAQGIDVLFKYEHKTLYIWAGYSLAWTKRFDGFRYYYPVFDRRHNANFVVSYKFGEKKDWETDIRWNFGSGFPFTKTQNFYEQLNYSDGPTTNYTTTNGQLGVQYAELSSGRLPYYHRMDISVKKNFFFTEDKILDISLSITNLYNRQNIFYFDRVKYVRVNQLPFLPTLGATFSF